MPGSILSARCRRRHRLVETLAALGQHVAERVERVGVHRIARDQVAQRALGAFDVALVLQNERQHVQAAGVVGIGGDERFCAVACAASRSLSDALTLGQQVEQDRILCRRAGRQRSTSAARSRASAARPADNSATARRRAIIGARGLSACALRERIGRRIPLLVRLVESPRGGAARGTSRDSRARTFCERGNRLLRLARRLPAAVESRIAASIERRLLSTTRLSSGTALAKSSSGDRADRARGRGRCRGRRRGPSRARRWRAPDRSPDRRPGAAAGGARRTRRRPCREFGSPRRLAASRARAASAWAIASAALS